MTSFLSSIDQLGGRIESDLRQADGSLRRLPAIAESALANFSDLDGLSVQSLAEFLANTKVGQQAKNPFSDLPVTVFMSRDFYIEVLVWAHATTSIHQHGFGGAFRVICGSSIHTRYRFESDYAVTDDLLVGRVSPVHSESLSVGSVRRIDPGMAGLVHSLYHLDNPSISLIVRDRGHLAFGPQYNYYPPFFAIHRSALEKDELVLTFGRLLGLTSRIDREGFMSIWCDHIARFEFPRLAWLYIQYAKYLEKDERAVFHSAAEKVHGKLVINLAESVDHSANQMLLSKMRSRLHDAELRFFLALLLNVPSKTDFLRMIEERFPDRDPVNCCVNWLVQLSIHDKAAQHRMLEVAQMFESAGQGAMQFSRYLRNALPRGVGVEEARSIFRGFICRRNVHLREPIPRESVDELEDVYASLAALPQLSALASDIGEAGKEQGHL